MENTMNTSEKIGELAGALAKAQTEFPIITKDSDNPYFHSKYADLAAVINATQKFLAKNGLVVIQSPTVDIEKERAGVVSVLAHSSGEWLSHECILPATMQGRDGVVRFDNQTVGSAITYARRYSYQAIVGVAAEVDDDGNAAAEGNREAGKSAARAVATEKLKTAANGDETATITPYKEGFVALSGPGLPIVRANMDNKMLAELGWKWEGKIALIPTANAFAFQDFCKKHGVVATLVDTVAKQQSDSGVPKAVIPPFTRPVPRTNGGQKSNDPVIVSAKRARAGAKEFLAVEWDGKKLSCWHKSMWVHLEHHVNSPAVLTVVPNVGKKDGKEYLNIEGIVSLDGEEFFSDPVGYGGLG